MSMRMRDRRVANQPVPTERRRGRPSVQDGEQTESVQVRLPKSMHDAVCRAAVARGESVSQVIRDALRRPTSTTAPP